MILLIPLKGGTDEKPVGTVFIGLSGVGTCLSWSVRALGGRGIVRQSGTIIADAVEGDGGSVTLTAADEVVLNADSLTTANAGTVGDGGEVVVYAYETAVVSEGATVEAMGGSESGDGGFAEVSGKNFILAGDIDLTAVDGYGGSLVIDPVDVIIADGLKGTEYREITINQKHCKAPRIAAAPGPA